MALYSRHAELQTSKVSGGTFFFTVTLADRTSDLLVREIDRLRRIYSAVQSERPFETIAICILPLLLLAAWLAVGHVRELQTRQADEAQNLARNYASAVDQNLQGRIRALAILAESPLALDTARRARKAGGGSLGVSGKGFHGPLRSKVPGRTDRMNIHVYGGSYVIPADVKWVRDLAVAKIVLEALQRMDPQLPAPRDDLKNVKIV